MNRKLDGTRLTTDDLIEIALTHGCITELDLEKLKAEFHNENLLRSALAQITDKVCFEMWSHHELILDTSDSEVSDIVVKGKEVSS